MEKNFDLAFQVIYEFNLPGNCTLKLDYLVFQFYCFLVIALVLLTSQIKSSFHYFQLLIYMLVLLHRLLKGRKGVS